MQISKKISPIYLFTLLLILMPLLTLADEIEFINDPEFDTTNRLLKESQTLDAKTLSPNNYTKAIQYYHEARVIYQKRGITSKVKGSLSRCNYYLDKAIESAKIAELTVGDLIKSREMIISKELYKSAENEFKKADNQLINILEDIEEGNLRKAKSKLDKAEKLYLETAITSYKDGELKQVESSLKDKRNELGKKRYKASKHNLDIFEDWLKDQNTSQLSVSDFILSAEDRIKDISGFLLPGWYQNMPDTLIFGDFTLYVETYITKGTYNLASDRAIGASGTAKIRFNCGNLFVIPSYHLLDLSVQTFTVVETVQNPDLEISLQEAQLINPDIIIGKDLTLSLPDQTVDKIGLSAAKNELLGSLQLKPEIPGIRVEFSDATIAPGERITIGTMETGTAVYPSEIPNPVSSIKLYIEGFQVEIDTLTINPTGAIGNLILRLPKTIVDGDSCEAATIPLGMTSITQDCQFYKTLSDENFGPWIIDPVGMEIVGTGIIVDFNKSYSKPGSGLMPDWRGVILENGNTIASDSGIIYSNSGYLKASYQFTNAEITGSGLETQFTLDKPFTFFSVVPYDYEISINSAYILMDSSRVHSGMINSGMFLTPNPAVCTGTPGTQINGIFSTVEIQKDLDLAGKVILTQDLYWGELSQKDDKEVFFQASPDNSIADYAWFYLNGKNPIRYVPSTDSDFNSTSFWGDITAILESKQIAGLTVTKLDELRIYTPDLTGSSKEIHFIDGVKCNLNRCWLNIETIGLSGEINISVDNREEKLGDKDSDYYKATIPFDSELQCITQKERCFFLRFASSALYDSEFHGILNLKKPCNTQIPFVDLEFTSAAHIVGGDIDLSGGPVTLEYWKLDLVETSPGDPAGALSVKTGQIILTQAGLS